MNQLPHSSYLRTAVQMVAETAASTFGSYSLRMLALGLTFLALTLSLDRVQNEAVLPAVALKKAESLAKSTDRADLLQSWFLLVSREGAAWLYLTGKSGELLKDTQLLAPPIGRYSNQSRRFVLKGREFYEAVVPYGKSSFLHLGFRSDPMLKALLSLRAAPEVKLTLMAVVFSYCAAWLGSYYFLVRPLSLLSRDIRRESQTGVIQPGSSLSTMHLNVKEIVELRHALMQLVLAIKERALVKIEMDMADRVDSRTPVKDRITYAGPREKEIDLAANKLASESNRLIDPLTGHSTVAFLSERLQPLFPGTVSKDDDPYSVILVSVPTHEWPDGEGRDRALKAMAEILSGVARKSPEPDKLSRFNDYIVRYTSNCFALVLGWADEGNALDAGGRIVSGFSRFLEAQELKQGAKPCVGVATCPRDGAGLAALLSSAFTALRYAEKECGAASVKTAVEVPTGYRLDEGSESVITGELGVLSGYGLLQSINQSKKTGELRVKTGVDELKVLFEVGEPRQISYRRLKGKDALVEFLVTCKQGSFKFKERTFSRGTKVLVQESEAIVVDRCLMDAAIAEDHMVVAQRALNRDECIFGLDAPQVLEKRLKTRADLTNDEVSALKTAVGYVDRSGTIGQLVDALTDMPTHLRWRSAYLLVELDVIQIMSL